VSPANAVDEGSLAWEKSKLLQETKRQKVFSSSVAKAVLIVVL
jgi:hypothetical protein